MENEVSSLELVWRPRRGGGGKTERTYLDFLVDGCSLGELLEVGDRISDLGWAGLKHDAQTVQTLLLKAPSPLQTGRVMLYVCAECGDIGCGAVTAQMEKTAEHFVWRDFGFENDYDPATPELKSYQKIGPFFFDKTDYWQALTHRPNTAESP